MSLPSLYRVETWPSWEKFCLECLHLALQKLRGSAPLPEGENALSGRLHECLRRAARDIRPAGSYGTINYECPPQPFGSTEESSRRLKPCPDIVWGFVDHHEPDVLRNAREFAIECKRLRHDSGSWKYNESYVKNGVRRFIDPQKLYGVGVSSGAMIGYWQDMRAADILREVNQAASDRSIPVLVLSDKGWQVATVSYLSHTIARSFPQATFQLHHLWIDLRGLCGTNLASKPTDATPTTG